MAPLREMDTLMVIGGMGANNDVEIVDLRYPEQSICSTTIATYPLGRSMDGLFFNGNAFVCGGQPSSSVRRQLLMGHSTSFTLYRFQTLDSDQCYVYRNETNEWESSIRMVYPRGLATSIQLSEDEIWMLGGEEFNTLKNWLNSTEVCTAQGCRASVTIPAGNPYWPKAVKINDTHSVFMTGSGEGKRYFT